MNMVMIALRDGRRFQELLKALRAAGAHSATILDSDGMDVLFFRGVRAHMDEPRSHAPGKTVLTMVPDALTESVIEAAEQALVGIAGMVCSFQLGHFAAFQGETRPAAELARRFA